MELELINLKKTYSTGKKALTDVTLTMKSPNLIGLLGPNGAGKSTLMKLLVAGILPTSGEIKLNGQPLLKKEKELKSKLGYLPQSFGLYEELSVWQFLDYISALKGIANKKEMIQKVIEETNLEEKSNTRISTLSGGQRQRVGIAQALLGNPEFLILDEPTVGLDPEERISFRNLFSKIAQDRIVLLSTHIIEDVQSICNRIIIIHKGTILFDGSPEELIKSARGHVGVYQEISDIKKGENFEITSRVNTESGVICRIVAQQLPSFATRVEATLEDAYMYCIAEKEGYR